MTEPEQGRDQEPDALDVLMGAAAIRPVVVQADEIPADELPQIPYVKSDRVPEVALDLEGEVCRVLTDRAGRDITAGMLRLERGRVDPLPPEPPRGFHALFEVLDGEGGASAGFLAAFDLGEGRYAVGSTMAHVYALRQFEDGPPGGGSV